MATFTTIPAWQLIENAATIAKKEKEEGVKLTSIGLPNVDVLLDGGFKIGKESIHIGAYAKMGKTTMLIHIATVLAQSGHKVLWIGLEESEYQTGARLIARGYNEEEVELYVDRNKLRKADLVDSDFVVMDGLVKYAKENMLFDSLRMKDAHSLYEIAAWAVDQGYEIICADYYQLFPEALHMQGSNSVKDLEQVSKDIARATDLGISVIVLFQRNEEGGVFGSTAITRDAQIVLHLDKFIEEEQERKGFFVVRLGLSRVTRGSDDTVLIQLLGERSSLKEIPWRKIEDLEFQYREVEM